MKKPLALGSVAVALVAAIVGVLAVNSASAAVTHYTATISGANEVPPGDVTTYTGSATLTIDSATNQVCVSATLNNPVGDPIILDHIHMGAAGTAGPVVVNFNNNLNTCVAGDPTVVANIIANPAGFYFNVHTMTHQGGAARGQLVLQADPTTTASTIATTTTTVSPTSTVRPVTATPSFTG